MRILTFILAITVFAMTIMSCADEIGCNILEVGHETSCGDSHENSHNHGDSEEGDDDCTPFCSCQCCGTSVTVPRAFVFEVEEPSIIHSSSYSEFYLENYTSRNSLGVWHPPAYS